MPVGDGVVANRLARIKQYTVQRELGRGGMGVVYECVDERIGQRVAIKVISATPCGNSHSSHRLRREATAISSLHHQGIVRIFAFDQYPDGTGHIVMEYLEGETLQSRLRQHGRLYLADALRITRQTAAACAAAHERKILHRDLKPDNMILAPDPEVPAGERVKLLDFGIARFLDTAECVTTPGMVLGTPAYMAPEQCAGTKLDEKADVYSLGVILFEMLAGRPPFLGTQQEVMRAHITRQPPSLRELVPSIPQEVDVLVDGMLSKAPEMRPEMDLIVARIREMELVATRGSPAQPSSCLRWGRRPRLTGAALVALASIMGIMTMLSTPPAGTRLHAERVLQRPARSASPAPPQPPRSAPADNPAAPTSSGQQQTMAPAEKRGGKHSRPARPSGQLTQSSTSPSNTLPDIIDDP